MASIETEGVPEVLLTPEIEDELNMEDDEEATGDELASEGRDEPEEYDFCRIERLLDHSVWLSPDMAFIQPVAKQKSPVKKGEFHSRFREFLRELSPNPKEPTSEILDNLFDIAVQAHQELFAWDKTMRAIKSKEFSQSLEYVRQKKSWFANVRSGFIKQRADRTPAWMSSWEHLWIGAFDELQSLIQAHLATAQRQFEKLDELGKLGRTDICSHILLLCRPSIESLIEQTPLSETPIIALAAFAHASRLLPLRDDSNDAKGRYVNKVKARLSRAATSKAKLHFLTFWLQSTIEHADQ